MNSKIRKDVHKDFRRTGRSSYNLILRANGVDSEWKYNIVILNVIALGTEAVKF